MYISNTRSLQAEGSTGLYSTCSKNADNGVSKARVWQIRLGKWQKGQLMQNHFDFEQDGKPLKDFEQ